MCRLSVRLLSADSPLQLCLKLPGAEGHGVRRNRTAAVVKREPRSLQLPVHFLELLAAAVGAREQ